MDAFRRWMAALSRWQGRHKVAAVAYAVTKKFSDDQSNLLVVALGWYGFTAIYPLLLVIVTVFGFVGEASLGTTVVRTLHEFPVVGSQFTPGSGGSQLHGSVLGLVIGCVGLVYGAQGVTQTAETALNRVWNLPQTDYPGFLPRLARSLTGLLLIGTAFLVNAFVASIAAGHGEPVAERAGLIVGLAILNVAFYAATFRALTSVARFRELLPGAVTAGIGFTALITVGVGLVQHQLRSAGATYGALAAVIGVVTFLLLLAKLTLYAAELNPVLARGLWPRALPMAPPTEADEVVLRARAREERGRPDERVGVGFGGRAAEDAAADARDDLDEDARADEAPVRERRGA
jgi:uncharacterized BrkB/YihY/UPF0761 family membrane protein